MKSTAQWQRTATYMSAAGFTVALSMTTTGMAQCGMDRAGVFGWINSIAVADGKVYATGNAGFKGAVWADGKCAVQKGANGENTVVKVFCVPARR